MSESTLLFCIGAQKAGTSWLSEQLRNHPSVFIPPIKELHHFDSLYLDNIERVERKRLKRFSQYVLRLKYTNLQDADQYDKTKWLFKYYVTPANDDDWYLSLFDFEKNQAKGKNVFVDNTPEYSILPISALEHIKRLFPQAKILFIMREPSSRMWSAIRYFSKNNPDKSLLDDIDKMKSFAGFPHHEKRNNYTTIINNFEGVFGKENVMTDFYENIFESSESQFSFLNQLCKFLAIPFNKEWFEESINSKINSTHKADIPEELRKHLSLKYEQQVIDIKATYEDTPENW